MGDNDVDVVGCRAIHWGFAKCTVGVGRVGVTRGAVFADFTGLTNLAREAVGAGRARALPS